MRLGRTVRLLLAFLILAQLASWPGDRASAAVPNFSQESIPDEAREAGEAAEDAESEAREQLDQLQDSPSEEEPEAEEELGEAQESAQEGVEETPSRPAPPADAPQPPQVQRPGPQAPEAPALPEVGDAPHLVPSGSEPSPASSSGCTEGDGASGAAAPILAGGPVAPYLAPPFRAARLSNGSCDQAAETGAQAWPVAPQSLSALTRGPGATPPWENVAAVALVTFLLHLLWVGFSRLEPDELMNHPRRARILEFVRSQPGVESNTVARALGLRWGPLAYHLARLERAGHLSVRRVGGRTALFPTNAGYRGKEEQMVLLRRSTLRRVHELLADRPGIDQSSISTALGVSQPLVSRCLQRLAQAGMVRGERKGRSSRYFSTAAAASPVARLAT